MHLLEGYAADGEIVAEAVASYQTMFARAKDCETVLFERDGCARVSSRATLGPDLANEDGNHDPISLAPAVVNVSPTYDQTVILA